MAHMNGSEVGFVAAPGEPAVQEQVRPTTQLGLALQRLEAEARSVDPQSCVARFGSAF
jgi:hypothetical protein